MYNKTLIIGKGKVGEATAISLRTLSVFHDPAKGYNVDNFNEFPVAIVCVDTLRKNPEDHSDLNKVITMLSNSQYKGIVAIRSTVSPNFVSKTLDNASLNIVLFPEFMRQTDDLKMDTPWIVVIGGKQEHTQQFKNFLIETGYCTEESKFHITTLIESSIIKLCQNAGLATKVIFYNMVNELCEKFNANYDKVRIGVGADKRVGIEYSLVPSPDDGKKGFQGHCLPKDIACLARIETHGFFSKVIAINKMLGR